MAGERKLIEYIEKVESTFNVNTIAVLFAMEMINDQELIDRLARTEREGRIWITEKLKDAGYKTLSMEGNYVLFLPERDSRTVVEELKKKNVWVRDYGRGILKGWVRVSTGSVACMEKFWQALVQVEKRI